MKKSLSELRHSLYTCLNQVIGYTEILLEEALDEKKELYIRDLNKIHKAAKEMGNLISLELTSAPSSNAKVEEKQHDLISCIEKDQEHATILIVDDNEMNRDIIEKRLQRKGYTLILVDNGKEALDVIQKTSIDLILLDIMMPVMDGYETLKILKEDPILRHIPVIMISAVDDLESVIRCIDMGAEDYLPKPFNATLLYARVRNSLTKKRLHDKEQSYLEEIEVEKEKSDGLLLNILPEPIAQKLKGGEQKVIADRFEDVSILFADLVGFTAAAGKMDPTSVLSLLNELFCAFDDLSQKYQLEKIKTIGDDYMVAGGLPLPSDHHLKSIANLSLDMQHQIASLNRHHKSQFTLRVGINVGPVVAGIIGKNKFCYDLWGDSVNIASRMESQGLPGKIQVTEAVYERLKDQFTFEKRSPAIDVRGVGMMQTYFLTGRKSSSHH